MKHTTMFSVGGQTYDIPQDAEADFLSKAQAGGYTPEKSQSFRVTAADGTTSDYDIPESQVEVFQSKSAEGGMNVEPLRNFTMKDGTRKSMTTLELGKFLRSKEYRESADFEESMANAEAAVPQVAPYNVGDAALQVGKSLFDAKTIQENAEGGGVAEKAFAYGNDLANSAIAGLIKGGAKIEQGVGNLLSMAPVEVIQKAGKWLVEDAQVGEKKVNATLPTNALDTNGNMILETGKSVAGMAGEFAPAAIPGVGAAYGASLVSAGATDAYKNTFDEAVNNGASVAKANGLATGAAVIDAAQNLMLMGKFRGEWSGELGKLASKVKANFVTDALNTGSIMGVSAEAQDVVQQFAEGAEYVDWERTVKAGGKGLAEGSTFHVLNAAAHKAFSTEPIKWTSEPKTLADGFVRDVLERGEGRALLVANNPEAYAAAIKARKSGENVSRKMLEKMGLPESVAPRAEDRNAIVDQLVKDEEVYRAKIRATMSREQSDSLASDVVAFVGAEHSTEVFQKAKSLITDAKDMDDPAKREEVITKAVEEVLGEQGEDGIKRESSKYATLSAIQRQAERNQKAKDNAVENAERKIRNVAELAEVGKQQEKERIAAEEVKVETTLKTAAERLAAGEIVTPEEAAKLKKQGKRVPKSQIGEVEAPKTLENGPTSVPSEKGINARPKETEAAGKGKSVETPKMTKEEAQKVLKEKFYQPIEALEKELKATPAAGIKKRQALEAAIEYKKSLAGNKTGDVGNKKPENGNKAGENETKSILATAEKAANKDMGGKIKVSVREVGKGEDGESLGEEYIVGGKKTDVYSMGSAEYFIKNLGWDNRTPEAMATDDLVKKFIEERYPDKKPMNDKFYHEMVDLDEAGPVFKNFKDAYDFSQLKEVKAAIKAGQGEIEDRATKPTNKGKKPEVVVPKTGTTEENSGVEVKVDAREAKIKEAAEIIAKQVGKSTKNAEVAETYIGGATRLLKNIEDKNANALRETLHNHNKGSIKAFEFFTGTKLPSSQTERFKAIDSFCGISPESRAEMDARREAEVNAKIEQKRRAAALENGKRIIEGTKINWNTTQELGLKKRTLDELIEKGWELKKSRRGAVNEGRIVDPKTGQYFKVPKGAYEYLEDVANKVKSGRVTAPEKTQVPKATAKIKPWEKPESERTDDERMEVALKQSEAFKEIGDGVIDTTSSRAAYEAAMKRFGEIEDIQDLGKDSIGAVGMSDARRAAHVLAISKHATARERGWFERYYEGEAKTIEEYEEKAKESADKQLRGIKLKPRDADALQKAKSALVSALGDLEEGDYTIKDGELVFTEKFKANPENKYFIDEFEEARDGLREFVEQAKKYYSLPKDAEGRPQMSPEKPAAESAAMTIEEIDRAIAAEDAAKAGNAAKASPDGFKPPEQGKGRLSDERYIAPNGPGQKWYKPLTSPNAVVEGITRLFPEFKIREQGTERMPDWAAGHWEPDVALIRTKDATSIGTISHEIGHGIDQFTKRGAVAMSLEAKRELFKLGHDLYGDKKPVGGYQGEGFAEYVRGFILDAKNLHTVAPELDTWFNTTFKKRNPQMVKRLLKLRDMVDTLKMQTPVETVRAFQKPSVSAFDKAFDMVKKAFSPEVWSDDLAPLRNGFIKAKVHDKLFKWQDEAAELKKLVNRGEGESDAAKRLAASISEKIESNPYMFASNVRGTQSQRMMDMAKFGTTNLRGTKKIGNILLDENGKIRIDENGEIMRDDNSEGLRDIFRGFSNKEIVEFSDYAVSRAGIENYLDRGKTFGLPRETLEAAVEVLKSEKYDVALKRYTDFAHRLLSNGIEAGYLTKAQYENIVKQNPIYVRISRRMDEGIKQRISQYASDGGKAVNKRTGGTQNVLPPIDALIMDGDKMLGKFFAVKTQQLLMQSVRKAARGNVNGDAPIAANLPIRVNNEMERVKFGSEKLRKDIEGRLEERAEELGMGADELFDELFDEGTDTLTIFREKPAKGKGGRISSFINDQLVTYELPDESWVKVFEGIEKGSEFNAFENIAATAAAGVRLGATTINPEFALKNAVRDTLHAAVMSETGAVPVVSTARGILLDVLNADPARLFKSMGGEMSDMIGMTKEQKFHNAGKVALAESKFGEIKEEIKSHFIKGSIKAVADVLQVPELGPRIREFESIMKFGEKHGLSHEASAALAMAHAKDISIDFQRAGTALRAINRVVPFANAAWRGSEQFLRNLGLAKALPHQFEQNGGKRFVKTAAKGVAEITTFVAGTALYQMMTSTEEERKKLFEQTPTEKWEYLNVGGIRIPLPFELGLMFGALPKAVVYEAYGDKGAIAEALKMIIKATPAKFIDPEEAVGGVAIISPIYDIIRNKNWNGKPIVSPLIMQNRDKKDWVDFSTTTPAKLLAEAVAMIPGVGDKNTIPPAYIDHVLNSYTGGLWKRVLSPAQHAAYNPFRTFISRPNDSRLVEEFYEYQENATRATGSGRISIEEYGKLKEGEKIRAELTEDFGKLRDLAARKDISDDERNAKRNKQMEAVLRKIRAHNDRKDFKEMGLAHAASTLTSRDTSADKKAQMVAILKQQDEPYAAAKALRRYGNQMVGEGKKRHHRWTSETIKERLKALNRELNK